MLVGRPIFSIKTESFEGPLDLLLSLVEKRKLFINDISLSKVTDDFIEHINQITENNLENRANFIVVASTLLLIKSKSLLPTLDLTTEEQGDISDLELRLKLLSKYKEASEFVKKIFGKNISFEGVGEREQISVFAPHESITKDNIYSAILSVIESLPKKEKVPSILVKKVVSLEETIDILSKRIASSLKMTFKDFSSKNLGGADIAEIKVNVIVSFLAMLELVKQGIISVEQESRFGEINMQSKTVEVPRYDI